MSFPSIENLSIEFVTKQSISETYFFFLSSSKKIFVWKTDKILNQGHVLVKISPPPHPIPQTTINL